MQTPYYVLHKELMDEGIEKLKEEIENMFLNSNLDYEQELVLTNSRHKDLLIKSIEYLNLAKNERIL